jgi:hypothetical protein
VVAEVLEGLAQAGAAVGRHRRVAVAGADEDDREAGLLERGGVRPALGGAQRRDED